jgi:hypothetical protein
MVGPLVGGRDGDMVGAMVGRVVGMPLGDCRTGQLDKTSKDAAGAQACLAS